MPNMEWYTLEDAQKEDDRKILIAMASASWANCYMEKPPAHFGEMMALIAKKIGEPNTPTNIAKLADEIIANK